MEAAPIPTREAFDKNIAIEYFDVMNPENYYPLVIDLADIEQITKKVEENIITGERKVQKKEKASFETDIITVRPIFPGCTITPLELESDLKKEKDVVTFYVTPLVKGDIKGSVQFLAKGKIAHEIETPSKVKDPRFGRIIAMYGIIASMIPKASALFSIDLGALLASATGLSLGGDALTSIIAVAGTGLAGLAGFLYALTHKPKNTSRQLHMSDFKLAIVPPKGALDSPW
jgi:hypothetical protein